MEVDDHAQDGGLSLMDKKAKTPKKPKTAKPKGDKAAK